MPQRKNEEIKISTPRGKIFLNTKTNKARLEFDATKFNGGGGGARGNGISWQGKFQKAQFFVDNEVLRLSSPYIPLLTGVLEKSGILGTYVGSGKVEWIAPYAKAQYYSPRSPGSQTGTLRGPFWFQRMKEARGQEIINGAKIKMGGG